MVLDVLARRDVTEAARIPRRDAGQGSHLRCGDDALRDLDPKHLDVVLTLPVRAADEPETTPHFRRDLAAVRTCPAPRRTRRYRAPPQSPDARGPAFSNRQLRPYTHLVGGSGTCVRRSQRFPQLTRLHRLLGRRLPLRAGAGDPRSASLPVQIHSSRVDAPHTIAARVSADQPCAMNSRTMSSRPPRPIMTTTVTLAGRTAASALFSPHLSARRRPESQTPCLDASPEFPRAPGAATAVVTPGTTSNGNPGSRQRERFFRAPAEHERVAALQPDDAFALPSRANHQPIDRVLLDARATGALADAETLRARQTGAAPRHRRARRTARDRPLRRAEARARSTTPDRQGRHRPAKLDLSP